MTDYFSEYSYVGAKGLPSPADTPYETPSFIRSKRSSRATAASSREHSATPPPLPPDPLDLSEPPRDGKFSSVDPRRFTPTLHASLVSEILNLRRELDSKNNLVDNLEQSLSTARTENDTIADQLAQQSAEVRKAKAQVQQIEKGTYEAVEDLVKERDDAVVAIDELKSKLDNATRRTRVQDEDAARTQGIWEREKEAWESERRQLERRVHVTENRLRTVIEEMTTQQAITSAQPDIFPTDQTTFNDSALGNESDTASVLSGASPKRHRRNISSVSQRVQSIQFPSPGRNLGTPEPSGAPNGISLADELAQDDVDEEDLEGMFSEERSESPDLKRQSSAAKRLAHAALDPQPTATQAQPRNSASLGSGFEYKRSSVDQARTGARPVESETKVAYVDKGYQPSPPTSPPARSRRPGSLPIPRIQEPEAEVATAKALERDFREEPAAPKTSTVLYSTASTQTDNVATTTTSNHTAKHRHSLSPPDVPSITIHPPTSRPPSPRAYVLPPRTKNASTQAYIFAPNVRHASMQTEPIRVDKRAFKLVPELLRNRASLLPSPRMPDSPPPPPPPPAAAPPSPPKSQTRKLSIRVPPPAPSMGSPTLRSPTETLSPLARENSNNTTKDLRSLRAIPLPRPVLSPPANTANYSGDGPLNRSAQYGVTRPVQGVSQLADVDLDSDVSDYEETMTDNESKDHAGSATSHKPPHGRFGLSEPPKVVPEEKEISPIRRPHTAGAHGPAPAPAVASSRGPSQRAGSKYALKLDASRATRSRSPSFGSLVSSNYSTQSASAFQATMVPPYPIPLRSSSWYRQKKPHSEGSQSPRAYGTADIFGGERDRERTRSKRRMHDRQNSLRKVQSAAAIRKSSPTKPRRRRRSPELTPVQSMAFEPVEPTKFPIPDLTTPTADTGPSFESSRQRSTDFATRASTNTYLSEADSSNEANLVDAIAATMVGEWMWKYVRKRKSFGLGEDSAADLPSSADALGGINVSVHGTRHKRWAWISPYERTIMWDNKQPTSGTALLGKKGRKLSIQSVLDVADNTNCPKSAELDTAFSRSILILTPARALKFTAPTRDRHVLWMTALSFLAQSGQLPAPLPQVPENSLRRHAPASQEPPPVKRSRSPAVGRSAIRDSLRLAKGRQPSLSQPMPFEQPDSLDHTLMPPELLGGDAGVADFPAVPRLYSGTNKHQRKRSNTSPRPRAHATGNGIRSMSSSAVSSAANSSRLQPTSTAASSYRGDMRSSSSQHTGSVRESTTTPLSPNFFEAMGTIRMEAFVDPSYYDGVRYVPAPPPPRRRRGDSNPSKASIDRRRAGGIFDDDGYDPFRAF